MTSTDIRVGFFLAVRSLLRSSKWTTGLIIVVMMLTFLNLVVVSGILVGLIDGVGVTYQRIYTGDIFISRLPAKTYIEQTPSIINTIERFPEVAAYSVRYLGQGSVEAGYKTRSRLSDVPDRVGVTISGIDPENEEKVTQLSTFLVEGEFLEPGEDDAILIGANLLQKYLSYESADLGILKQADLGTKVRLSIGTSTREMTIKGILKSKVDEIDRRVFMSSSLVRKLIGRTDNNASEIAIRLIPGAQAPDVKSSLVAAGIDDFARVQLSSETEPQFVKDIKRAFSLLGNIIGSVGIVVACITIFIVIFVNAITRRKYIGIMKGIGVSRLAIEISYIFQSLFFAIIGSGLGLLVLYGLLVPYFATHPIDFPFSDGILVAPLYGTFLRVLILLCATLVAGYVPAKLVTRQNTLDAILGR